MKRDGALESLWQYHMPGYQHEKDNKVANKYVDVVIVGGGITGITTGLLLQKAGKSVLIAEAHNIGFGTTGGTTAHLNSFMETPFTSLVSKFGLEKAQAVAKAARQAIDLIKKHVQEYNIDCGFKELPGYIFAENEKQEKEFDEVFEGFQQVGAPVSISNTSPVKVPFIKAMEIPGQAQFHPTRYIYALPGNLKNWVEFLQKIVA